MTKISTVTARTILDSRGNPTVEADVVLEDGTLGRAAVPSGASTGSREAMELRDGDKSRYNGKSVSTAVENVNTTIADKLIGMDAGDQQKLDDTLLALDGTDNKSSLGANATLAVSLAAAKAQAVQQRISLYKYIAALAGSQQMRMPLPMMNILNGGKHAIESTDIQEFMIIPNADSIFECVRVGAEVFHSLKKVLSEADYSTLVGDEGGFAPSVANSQEALDLIGRAADQAGHTPGTGVHYALDVAATELVDGDHYAFEHEGKNYTSEELIAYYERMADAYPLMSIEDGLGEDDWDGWIKLTEALGQRLNLVGDDLLVTNTAILKDAIERKAGNAILIKPNQIGTLSETIEAVQTAQQAGWKTIVSHRSGETEDTTIAHIAVGLGTDFIKTGSLSRTDRVAKYNELMRIAEESPEIPMSSL